MTNTRGNLVAASIYETDENGKSKGSISVDCMFNPFEYTVSKTNDYQDKAKNNADVPHFEFTKAGPQTLKLTLFFDSYEDKKDISETTNKLWKLMESKTRKDGKKNKKIPPPYVAFEWGVFKFVSVITNMSQKFTLFTKDGVPVRAQVDITFTQYKDLNDYPGQNPTSGGGPLERVRQVIAGDRLDTIAYEVYGDSTKWHLIAERNHIKNPLALRPGMRLAIPEE